ncbi:MAG: hypothetical protein IPG74_14320 [Flavobacteriales bacterium]|nr:hypothetical protein [Flavobacteriales bacterium]MBK7554483.1 hypothetical protein [Flavobacteriales bacterium]MBK9195112.1 hypothetical protein [Flavobacteriales bacterium]
MGALRFHWDFFGPDAVPTAEHFVKHLHQFCEKEGVAERKAWTTPLPIRCTATLECDESHMLLIRDRLKPKRAERVG